MHFPSSTDFDSPSRESRGFTRAHIQIMLVSSNIDSDSLPRDSQDLVKVHIRIMLVPSSTDLDAASRDLSGFIRGHIHIALIPSCMQSQQPQRPSHDFCTCYASLRIHGLSQRYSNHRSFCVVSIHVIYSQQASGQKWGRHPHRPP